jgi:hypothetical protein
VKHVHPLLGRHVALSPRYRDIVKCGT